jgi:hypothetical protein
MTRIAREVADDIGESYNRISDLTIAEGRRTCCHDHGEGYDPAVALIVPFPASHRKVVRVKRPEPRDRLLNDQHCQAASECCDATAGGTDRAQG